MRIVLLPGLDGTGELFEPLRRKLPPSFQVTTVSYPRRQKTTYSELVTQVLPILPRSEPFILLGESYGGPLSLKIAATQPVGLCGLILSASFVKCPHSYVPRWSERLLVPAVFYPAPIVAKIKAIVGRYSTREIQTLIDRSLATVAPAVVASRIREVIKIDVTEELVSCPVPILYIQGTKDHVVPSGNLKRIQKLRPDVTAVRVEAPHMVLQTRAEAAAQAIDQFAEQFSEKRNADLCSARDGKRRMT